MLPKLHVIQDSRERKRVNARHILKNPETRAGTSTFASAGRLLQRGKFFRDGKRKKTINDRLWRMMQHSRRNLPDT